MDYFQDKVSIIIPTFGRPISLKRAINSALFQTYSNIEVIIVDDNNPDSVYRKKTSEIISEIKDSRVVYIKHESNLNGATARNTGIKNSKGKFISFLDDDDEFEPNKLEEQIKYLKNRPELVGVYCKAIHFKNNKPYYKTSYVKEGNLQYDILIMAHEIYTPSLVFYTYILNEVNGFNELFKRHQDYDLLIRITENYSLGCVDSFLIKIFNDDKINQPSFKEYEKNKLEFLNNFSEYIKLYGKKSKFIKRTHYFDLSFYAFKKYDFINWVKYLFLSKPNFSLLKNVFSKVIKIFKRKISK
jgi:glycosyltransferase involved in cell wall biosynthesis